MKLKLNSQGLIPAIAQDAQTGEVLMVAYMSPESVQKTLQTGDAWFYSRTRKELWRKGDTSGNVINVASVEVDCDGDTIILKSNATGPACHTGAKTCFFQTIPLGGKIEFEGAEQHILDELSQIIESRKEAPPEGSYVGRLLQQGVDRIGKKVLEEAAETVIAAKNAVPEETVHEVADLWFHSLVLLAHAGLTPEDVWQELRRRRH